MSILLLLLYTLFPSSLLHAHPTSPSPLLSSDPASSPQLNTTSPSTHQLLTRSSSTSTCPSNLHIPTVSTWHLALTTYCSRHTPVTITRDSPLIFSYSLTAYDQKPIKWLFKVWIDGNIYPTLGHGEDKTEYTFRLSKEVCEERFMAMVKGEEKGGGGMPKVVCEVDGSGEKLFWGGNYREWLVKGLIGQVVWETRQVKGN